MDADFDWRDGADHRSSRYTWVQQAYGRLLRERIDQDALRTDGPLVAPLCDLALISAEGFWQRPLPGLAADGPAPTRSMIQVLARGTPLRLVDGLPDRWAMSTDVVQYMVELGPMQGTPVWFGDGFWDWPRVIARMLLANADAAAFADPGAGSRLVADLREIARDARRVVLAGKPLQYELEAEAAWRRATR